MSLPIDPLLPEITGHLQRQNTLVIEAPPGAGKTTRVPAALLDAGAGHVLVLEPRRIAARLAARFVASSRGEAAGQTVGYQVRFEDVSGPRTRLQFLTEGVLTRRLLSDKTLSGVSTVVLDEFHERHIEGDLALALLRRLQETSRPDLHVIVMSATLNAGPVAEYLGARVLRSEGRQYPLAIEYTPHSPAPLEQQVCAALERVAAAGFNGHALIFLPGAAEIRRAMAACAPLARRYDFAALPLHGDLSPEEQDRAVAPSSTRKAIFSTNVAESSVTIEGVTVVIDSGVARMASHSPWSGLPTLQVARVSQASANQRAGRAGRNAPGRAVRLFPLEDFVRRPEHDVPEIAREDLAPVALELLAMGFHGFDDLAWLDPPPAAAVEHAIELLRQLGARGRDLREMARYPVHPRLARLILEAGRRGVAHDGATLAAILESGERLPTRADHATRSDLLILLESEWEPRTARAVRQMKRLVKPAPQRACDEDALLISVLAAFPDRVARRRQDAELQLASGGSAMLSPASTVTQAEFLVAVEVEDRRDQKLPLVRIASAVEPEWLFDLFPDRVRETAEVQWNRAGERVESVSALRFDDLVIEESRHQPDPEPAAALLAQKALDAGITRFADADEITAFLERVAFAAEHGAVPQLGEEDVRAALAALAYGLKSFGELRSAAADGGLLRALEARLPASAQSQLERLAPARLRLAGGRAVKVHYEPGQPPWIASRLQDFFGMRETPHIAGGAVPVVVRLLAPNQRPVQMTTDLAGFWERWYPQLRRELARRYPKHAWPEKP